ncbi:uncharacterized protein BJX67DRAFT_386182 [Aspergillus lucknowensis]|uniref:Uncharacterized protein n=1 Tax=Aspergillus lucknowensis TaxID=176173 RepID=A0ABR4L8U6_9EURO
MGQSQRRKMKRKASASPYPLQSERLPARGPPSKTDDPSKHDAERQNDEEEKHRSAMAKYWAAKAEALKEPFCPEGQFFGRRFHATMRVCICSKYVFVGGRLDAAQRIKDSPSQTRIPDYQWAQGGPPLSNDAIANILMQCRPGCPRSLAWIRANEVTKIAKARLKAKLNEHGGLRKQVLEKLRAKTLEALKQVNASQDEVREVLSMLPERDDDEMTEIMEPEPGLDEELLTRVMEAHERLQNTMREAEELRAALTAS